VPRSFSCHSLTCIGYFDARPKYHLVFIPKKRKKKIFEALRRHLGEIFRELAKQKQKESQVVEGHPMGDHVHMCLSIPLKYAVSNVVGLHQGQECDSDSEALRRLGLFDERNLFECSSALYPGERLVACRNPELAKLRAHKRSELLAATETNLAKIKARVDAGKLAGADQIGLRVGKLINQYKVAKHFELAIGKARFTFARKPENIAAEAALEGLYIIRTSVSPAQMDAADSVRRHKALANVERAFRSLKTIDLKVRPIHHRLADRVRAHILLCTLAYYVMLSCIIFDDSEVSHENNCNHR